MTNSFFIAMFSTSTPRVQLILAYYSVGVDLQSQCLKACNVHKTNEIAPSKC